MPNPSHNFGTSAEISSLRPNSATRIRVAEAYRLAFNGSATLSISSLDASPDLKDPLDRIHIERAKSHLLYLDGESDQAFKILDQTVLPLVEQFAPHLREAVDYQRTVVASNCDVLLSAEEAARHCALVDRRASVGFESGDPSKLLEADRAAADGKLYDAMPIYTSAFYAAFHAYDWLAWKQAAGRLSRLTLQLGDVSQATFYSFVSEDDATIGGLVRHLIARNDPEEIDKSLDMLKRKANLNRHRSMAFKIVGLLGEAVPDHRANEWSELSRSYRRSPLTNRRDKTMFDEAWNVSSAVAPGLPTVMADQLAEDALGHPLWPNPLFRRESFYPAIKGAIPNLSQGCAGRVAETVISHIVPPIEYDFEAALFLLMTIYQEHVEQREFIKAKIFSIPDLLPPHLARFAEHFNLELPIDYSQPYFEHAHKILDQQIQERTVSYAQDITVLLVLASRRKRLQQNDVDGVVLRMVELVQNSRNVNLNRVRMLLCVELFVDSVSVSVGRMVASVCSKYAGDHRLKGHPLYGEPEQEDPLNSFRMGSARGWPQQVRGQALMVLGAAATRPELLEEVDVDGLIRTALYDHNATVRHDACVAVHRAVTKLQDILKIVLILALDPQPEVARVALRVLAVRIKDVAALSIAASALAAARTQACHVDLSVRTAAAEVIAALRDFSPTVLNDAQERELQDTGKQLATDIARSVRTTLTMKPN